jgi:hypothetical protein
MSNVLKVSLQETICTLDGRGWSGRRIARELGIDRETVGRYLLLAKPAISTTGSEEAGEVLLPAAHVITAKHRCPTRHIALAYPGFPSICYSTPYLGLAGLAGCMLGLIMFPAIASLMDWVRHVIGW